MLCSCIANVKHSNKKLKRNGFHMRACRFSASKENYKFVRAERETCNRAQLDPFRSFGEAAVT